jgi:hypothetical protein
MERASGLQPGLWFALLVGVVGGYDPGQGGGWRLVGCGTQLRARSSGRSDSATAAGSVR